MLKHRKTWSSEEKEKIILHSTQHGVIETSREFGQIGMKYFITENNSLIDCKWRRY